MKFFITEENSTGEEFTTREDFLDRLNEIIDECEIGGVSSLNIEVYTDED